MRSGAGAIRIKPHHLVDIIAALGAGQVTFEPHPYGHAVHTVAARVLADPDTLVEIDLGADDICAPCVHNVGGLCDDTIDTSFRPEAPTSKMSYNLLIDRRWCEHLSLTQGERITARQFCAKLTDICESMPDIYREEPPALTAGKARDLQAGIRRYLG